MNFGTKDNSPRQRFQPMAGFIFAFGTFGVPHRVLVGKYSTRKLYIFTTNYKVIATAQSCNVCDKLPKNLLKKNYRLKLICNFGKKKEKWICKLEK